MLYRAQFILFPMFHSIPHSLVPLAILERHIPSQSNPLYKVIHHVEACTTGFSASCLPEPKAAWVVWAVSLSIETTQLINASESLVFRCVFCEKNLLAIWCALPWISYQIVGNHFDNPSSGTPHITEVCSVL